MNLLPPEIKCLIGDHLNTKDRYHLSKCSKEWYKLLWQPIQIDKFIFDLIFLIQAESYSFWPSATKNYVVSNFSFFLTNDDDQSEDMILFGFTYVGDKLYLKIKKDTIGETPFLLSQIHELQALMAYGFELEMMANNEMEWSKRLVNANLDLFHEHFILMIKLFKSSYHEIYKKHELCQLYFKSLVLSILITIYEKKLYCPDDLFFYWNEHEDISDERKMECRLAMKQKSREIYESIRYLDKESIYRISDYFRI